MTPLVNGQKWIMWINLWKTLHNAHKLRVNSRKFDRHGLFSHNTSAFIRIYLKVFSTAAIPVRNTAVPAYLKPHVANAALSQLSYIPKYQLPDYYIRAAVLLSSMNLKVIPAKECGHLLGFLRKEGMSRLSCLTLPLTEPELFTLLELCVLLCWEDP